MYLLRKTPIFKHLLLQCICIFMYKCRNIRDIRLMWIVHFFSVLATCLLSILYTALSPKVKNTYRTSKSPFGDLLHLFYKFLIYHDTKINQILCQCEFNLIKFICYCVLSSCLLKAHSTIESLSIYIILKNPQRRGIRTLAYCV